jgi:HEPN domain-containing protein
MSDREHAQMLLGLARRDLTALRGMLDVNIFANEIFGFHAQQAVEKALKAWLSLIGIEYPRIHDLEELLALLEQQGATVPEQFYGLIDLTDFAVQFRYAAFEEADRPLERLAVINQVTEVVEHVAGLLTGSEKGIKQ